MSKHDKTMRAIVKPDRSPGLKMVDVPIPAPGPREALIKVAATSICGTDMHIFKWDPWAQSRIRPPVIVGHEFCGEVVEVGEVVSEVRVGDFVSAESHIICHAGTPCRTGRGHLCQNTQIIGVDRDGCWAEYIVMPAENLWVNPPDMPLEVASLQENFGNAVHTAFAADVTARRVLVTGCGPVGLMAIMVAKAAGARAIYATDIANYRLHMAHEMGAEYLELANTQYYSWAYLNRHHLLPTHRQLQEAEAVTTRWRERLARSGDPMKLYFVAPDYHETRPKRCVNGWGSTLLNVTPDGVALPCHTARMLPGAAFPDVRHASLKEIWFDSEGFNRFRGTGWMKAPCANCEHREQDLGGCRCQAWMLTGDPAAADPVCDLSPHHGKVTEAVAAAEAAGVAGVVGTAGVAAGAGATGRVVEHPLVFRDRASSRRLSSPST